LRSFVLRALLPRTVAFAGGASILVLGHAMAVDPSAHSDAASSDMVAAAPSWTPADTAGYPGCVPSAAWPAGRPASYLVVHRIRDDTDLKMPFDDAWRANHDETEVDDVWVLGVCG
jgi:hypothetical protein